MSGVFKKPGTPKLPAAPARVEEVAPIEEIEEDAETARRRERKKLLRGGRKSTILGGIMSALKLRLGR